MDSAMNKALTVGVGIFITLIIVTGVFAVITQINNIYAQVYNLDTNLNSRFDEFTKYDNADKTGVDMINAANKFYNENLVIVEYNGRKLNDDAGLEYLEVELSRDRITYDMRLYSTIETVEENRLEKTKITFKDH